MASFSKLSISLAALVSYPGSSEFRKLKINDKALTRAVQDLQEPAYYCSPHAIIFKHII